MRIVKALKMASWFADYKLSTEAENRPAALRSFNEMS